MSNHLSKLQDQFRSKVALSMNPTSPQKEKPSSSPISSGITQHQVVVVIAGRNSEKYLDEAIRSVLSQTVPCEIIYSDDASTDSSLRIAYRHIHNGVRVISHHTHTGVCATRNRGANASRAPYIIFMDSDDILTPTYVEDMLTDLSQNPGTPFIYPSTNAFGSFDRFWKNLEWSKYDCWSHNQVSTTSMWSRMAFLAAGQWQELPTMWDYDLALRCSKFGIPVAGRAVLKYRIHDNSVSSLLNERMPEAAIPYKLMIRRRNASLGIGSLLSGRLPGLFPRWLDRLALSVRYAWTNPTSPKYLQERAKPRLYLLLHNDAEDYLSLWSRMAERYTDTFHSIEFGVINTPPIPRMSENVLRHQLDNSCKVSVEEWEADKARRLMVSTLLATGCQTIQDYLRTDLVWLLEDDIMIPMDACELLFNYVTTGNTPPIGVSGRYYSRHPGCLNQIGGWIKDGKHFEPHSSFRTAEPVDFLGTGCLMYWPYRPASPKAWRPISKIENATAHDWAWSEDVVARGGDLLALGCVDCLHHIDEDNAV